MHAFTRPSRRGFLAGTAGLAAIPQAFAQTPSVSFLVIGDWGESSNGQHAVAGAMGRVGAEIGSAFVISTGDNFYSRGVASVDDPQWTETFESAFSAPSLQTPWYAVLGNHDYRGSISAEIDYTIESPRWHMPSRYWRQDIAIGADTASFFMLDTFPLTHLGSARARVPILGDSSEAHAQLRWLEADLAASRARWKIVVGHHPILSSGAHGGDDMLAQHVQPLLQRYAVNAYFNGHDHDLELLRDGDVNYICSGAGSEFRGMRAPLPQTRFSHSGLGFVSCQLGEAPSVRFHDGEGRVLHTAHL